MCIKLSNFESLCRKEERVQVPPDQRGCDGGACRHHTLVRPTRRHHEGESAANSENQVRPEVFQVLKPIFLQKVMSFKTNFSSQWHRDSVWGDAGDRWSHPGGQFIPMFHYKLLTKTGVIRCLQVPLLSITNSSDTLTPEQSVKSRGAYVESLNRLVLLARVPFGSMSSFSSNKLLNSLTLLTFKFLWFNIKYKGGKAFKLCKS